MNGLIYLLQVNIYLLAFYSFYKLFLEKETFFNLNRIYLITSGFFSFFIPILSSDWVNQLFITEQVKTVTASINLEAYNLLFPSEQPSGLTLKDALTWIYITVAVILSVRLIIHLLLVLRKIKRSELQSPAYSFFGFLKVDEELTGRDKIYRHEMVHYTQLHSADVLFFEVIAIVAWFNPIVYLYKRAIKQIHEFIADQKASALETDKTAYAMLLVSQTFGIDAHQLTNNFFNNSLLRKRIIMLQKSKSKKAALLKYGLTAPLFLAMLILSSAFVNKKSSETVRAINPEEIVLKTDPAITQPVTTLINDTVPEKEGATSNKSIGKPIYIVDGKPMSEENAKKLDPKNILTVDVKKGGQAEQAYGTKGEFGVISITTKAVSDASSNNGVPTYTVNGVALPEFEKDKVDRILNTLPLYVVDGVPKAFEIVNRINPNDILTVNVLKGDQTQKYGAKAENGVVEITTKKIVGSGTVGSQQDDVKNFSSVEVTPSYPGGLNEFYKYIGQNFKYPADAVKNKVSGRVIVSFVVEKDGDLTDIKILRDLGYGTGAEAVRVLENSALWKPGIQDGKPVRVAYTLPIALNINK